MTSFLRIFLPVFFLIFLLTAMFWRSYQIWKRTGINPYKLGSTDSAHDYNGQMLKMTLLSSVLVVGAFSFFPGVYEYLTPIDWLENPVLAGTGIVLLIAALIWILVAQSQMGNSWRIGIDDSMKTLLVQNGLFSISRNPIFLGMRVLLLGFFMALPNALTLAILVLGEALMQIQVRLEESYLAKTQGEDYLNYCRQVRRWL